MSRTLFATSHAGFAISPVFAPAAFALFFSLFNPLKKKKKESGEGQGIGRNSVPLVGGVLPSVADGAYFLSHGLLTVAMPE